MNKDRNLRYAANAEALTNPKPGDYWSEMFSPYFIIVDVKGDDIYVLSTMGGANSHGDRKYEPNAKKDAPGDCWGFDYTKAMIVDKGWLKKTVMYSTIGGFVADVASRSDLISDWQEYLKENPYEIPRLSDLIKKNTPPDGIDSLEVLAKEHKLHLDANLKRLLLAVIAKCSRIAEDADIYRVPSYEYARLISEFKNLKKEDFVPSLNNTWSEP